jgi:hypothetical protein
MNRTHALLAASLIVVSAVICANAATREEQSKACRGDALHFCAVHIPNREKIIACMKQHLDELSPKCRAMFRSDKPDNTEGAQGTPDSPANPQ